MIQSYESGPNRASDFWVLRNYRGQLVTHNRKTGISMLGIRLFMDQSLRASYEVDQLRPYAFYEDPGIFDLTLPLKRILEREETLASAKLIDPVSLDEVVLGSVVYLRTKIMMSSCTHLLDRMMQIQNPVFFPVIHSLARLC